MTYDSCKIHHHNLQARESNKRSRREKRDGGMATHTVRPTGETRRAGATAAPRQDEGERGDGGDADGGKAAGDREQRWSVVFGIWSFMPIRRKRVQSRRRW
mmetsp:Transcript_31984/g.79014  ORF Transcript_31984/g.79014 Transcript_31984/m.79014 type:complete len:101 (+) Transcript_31984:334-636(+)